MARYYRALMIAGITILGVATARPAVGYLSDLAGHWAAPVIGALEIRGIVSGDEQGRFDPEAPMTRAQLAKLLAVSLGSQDDATILARYPSRFSDVVRWHWARGYIEALAETGALEGYGDGTFGPEDTVTRAQMATMMVRLAGLADQANLTRFERTVFTDDSDIPDWARGAINVARSAGLMNGFADGTFRPGDPVTRAEGSVTLFRFLAARGDVFHLTGTLVRFEPATGEGELRDDLGRIVPFTMAQDAHYFRNGSEVPPWELQPLDQVWILKGANGNLQFLDARYGDLLAQNLAVNGQTITVTLNDSTQKQLQVQEGAPVFLNGASVSLAQSAGANLVYLALDLVTGEARAVDAVTAPWSGSVVGYDSTSHALHITVANEERSYPVAPEAILLLNGQRVSPADLTSGTRVQFAVNNANALTYLLAEE